MSRQRAGWGLSRFMESFEQALRPKSQTAGTNKYDPQTANRAYEAERRLRQAERLKAKLDRRRNESGTIQEG